MFHPSRPYVIITPVVVQGKEKKQKFEFEHQNVPKFPRFLGRQSWRAPTPRFYSELNDHHSFYFPTNPEMILQDTCTSLAPSLRNSVKMKSIFDRLAEYRAKRSSDIKELDK